MEHPVREIPHVIHTLVTGNPSLQRKAVETYFTEDASFTHPFCRTGSFPNSRWLIVQIYRWYKILSPKIELQVDSVAFDEKHLLLYVSIHQLFSIWLIPFYNAHVRLTTVLELVKMPQHGYVNMEVESKKRVLAYENRKRYYIRSQQDLYQTSEFVKFIAPLGGMTVVVLWQFVATVLCVVGAAIGFPVTWLEENVIGGNEEKVDREFEKILGAE